ncbi:MAG: glycosyltransferase [Pseudomonadota bacterium]
MTAGEPHIARPVPLRGPGPERATSDVERDRLRAQATREERLQTAVHGLSQSRPDMASYFGLWRWQWGAITALPIAFAVAVVLSPTAAISTLLALATIAFLAASIVRIYAIAAIVHAQPMQVAQPCAIKQHLPDEALPTYTVLVPIFREATIVRDLMSALSHIDYPRDKLTVLIVCEEDDRETLDELARTPLPPQVAIIEVPAMAPRTKPKALNFALTFVTSDLVVVFDAEDVPEPDQLRRAASTFFRAPHDVACLQARLNIYNRADSWLTRQFTLEYSALFDGLLPALERLRLPIPLGGTSNHFKVTQLNEVGGWDAFNVTEDADLGIRLARSDLSIHVLPSTTWEEAPSTMGAWGRQRTRWMLGWLQTYAVHMRQPLKLLNDLGAWRFVGFQVLALGLLATVYLHPISYLALLALWVTGTLAASLESNVATLLLGLAALNLGLGVLTTLVLAGVAVIRRGWFRLLPALALMPVYWLLTSCAAYRAVGKLFAARRRPINWEKTAHRSRRPEEQRPNTQQPNTKV